MILGSNGSKRRRLPLRGGERESWASLDGDLVQLIGWWVLLGDLLDYIRFRAVCSHWNSSTVNPHGRGLVDPRFHPRRWMMFPEGHALYPGHPNLDGYVRFFNLSSGTFVRVHLPLLDDHVVLDSTDGLLLLLDERDTTVGILQPFTGDMVKLPPLLSQLRQLEPQKGYHCITEEYSGIRELGLFLRGVSAAVNVTAAGKVTVLLGIDIRHRVAYATVGDQQWSLSAWKLPHLSARTVSFQGKLYAAAVNSVDNNNNVYICQIDLQHQNAKGLQSLSLPSPRMIAKSPLVGTIGSAHLVECGSELMLVGFNDMSRSHLVVYRLADLISGRVVPVTSIGEHAIFLEERGICVSPNKGFPSVLGNTIICKHRSTSQLESCIPRQYFSPRFDQFDLGSGTWSPSLDVDILRRDRTPASPYTLSHHILTCCYRSYWNKGIILCAAVIPSWSVKPSLWKR